MGGGDIYIYIYIYTAKPLGTVSRRTAKIIRQMWENHDQKHQKNNNTRKIINFSMKPIKQINKNLH
jgi:hypothetical protein